MSPNRQQSTRTPDLIRNAGFDICLDWEMDVQPLAMKTDHGALHTLPVLNELDDRFLLQTKHHSEGDWIKQVLEAVRYSAHEADTIGSQSLAFTMTPYIAGQPFRMWAVREILDKLASNPDVMLAPAHKVVDGFQTASV